MRTEQNTCDSIIADAYQTYRPAVLGYFTKRLVQNFEAEDLTQDVFIKLVGLGQMLRQETVQYLIFTIARNLCIDYNRRFFKKLEVCKNVLDESEALSCTTEDCVAYNELLLLEQKAIDQLPAQRKKVYQLSMHGDYSYREMAENLQISPRTIEKHLLMGRNHVRNYIAACI